MADLHHEVRRDRWQDVVATPHASERQADQMRQMGVNHAPSVCVRLVNMTVQSERF
jgi:hypothetical protein